MNNITRTLKAIADKHTITADAHCDVPCGIYDPTAAKVAARTVARMVDQIEELDIPKDMSDKQAVLAYQNSVSRRIAVKETHAEICKHELSILWTDFFKEEHLARYPELHTHMWKATKLCSQNKQHIDKEAAQELLVIVDEIARMFYEVKGDAERFGAYQKITDSLY